MKNKKLPKNNSFDENSSPIKAAMAASLAADDVEEEFQPRSRLISDGIDVHQLNTLNATARNMIKSEIS